MIDIDNGCAVLAEAFRIFGKYTTARNVTHCAHDRLTVVVSPSVVSPEDAATLKLYGFHVDEDEDCFYSFRFGSC